MMRFIWDLLMFAIYGGTIFIVASLVFLFAWLWVGLMVRTASWVERRWW